jgi:hypothetical protein
LGVAYELHSRGCNDWQCWCEKLDLLCAVFDVEVAEVGERLHPMGLDLHVSPSWEEGRESGPFGADRLHLLEE